LCAAIQLKKAGIHSFTIFEKSAGVGGTWRDNSYPGSGCDVPSFLYSFSFEQKLDWKRKYAQQPEILGYLEQCASSYGLLPHTRFGAEVTAARFDDSAGVWRLRTVSGEDVAADVVVCGLGQLNRPLVPEIPGLADFGGTAFHSARWRHDRSLDGRNVAVIGNAASAVQLVPEIAPKVARLTLFHRSANWIAPKPDRVFTEREHEWLRRFPILARLYRLFSYLSLESRFLTLSKGSRVSKLLERLGKRDLEHRVKDPELRAILTPDYPVGCKRILISNEWYETLSRDNVDVVTAAIDHVTRDGIVTKDGKEHAVDTIIFATGFETTRFLAPVDVRGSGGTSLNDAWARGAEAYLGMTVPDFPNFFILYGPNTNLGHNSIIFMIECQVGYLVQCIRALVDRDLAYIDVRHDVLRRYTAELEQALDKLVWTGSCVSWYKNEHGRVTNNWPYTTLAYWWRTRRPRLADFRQVARNAPSGEQRAAA
jgi:cation diffusion facilitator CzcD-associated flavoprotein CzcO